MDKISPVPEPVLPILPDGSQIISIPVGKDASADGLLLLGGGSQPNRAGNRPASPENPNASLSAPLVNESGELLPDEAYTLRLGSDDSASLPPDAAGRPRPVSSYDSFGRSTLYSAGETPAAASGLKPGAEYFRSGLLPGYSAEMKTFLPDSQIRSLPRQANPPASPGSAPKGAGGEGLPSHASRAPALPGRAAPDTSEDTADLDIFSPPDKGAAASKALPTAREETDVPISSPPGGPQQDPNTPAIKADAASAPDTPRRTSLVSSLAAGKLPVLPAESGPSRESRTFEELAEHLIPSESAEAERVLPRAFSGSFAAGVSHFRGEPLLPYAFAPFGEFPPNLRRRAHGEEEEILPPPMEGGDASGARGEFLRLSEAVRMACLLRCLHNGGDVRFEIETPWYGAYVRYAIQNGILQGDEFPDYNAFATRAQGVYLFSRCVPSTALAILCHCPLPSDVHDSDWFAEGVARLLCAGVLDCADSARRFFPDRLLTRSEAVSLLGKIATPSDRRCPDGCRDRKRYEHGAGP